MHKQTQVTEKKKKLTSFIGGCGPERERKKEDRERSYSGWGGVLGGDEMKTVGVQRKKWGIYKEILLLLQEKKQHILITVLLRGKIGI